MRRTESHTPANMQTLSMHIEKKKRSIQRLYRLLIKESYRSAVFGQESRLRKSTMKFWGIAKGGLETSWLVCSAFFYSDSALVLPSFIVMNMNYLEGGLVWMLPLHGDGGGRCHPASCRTAADQRDPARRWSRSRRFTASRRLHSVRKYPLAPHTPLFLLLSTLLLSHPHPPHPCPSTCTCPSCPFQCCHSAACIISIIVHYSDLNQGLSACWRSCS